MTTKLVGVEGPEILTMGRGPIIPMTGSVFSEFEIRDMDMGTNGALTRLAGLAVPYDRPADIGPFTEEFTPGAFKNSIQGGARHLPLLLFHNDRGWPIGRSEEWHDRPDGLHGVWALDTGEDAQRAAHMARDGMLSYLSIRFQQDGDRYRFDNTRSKPHFVRQSARLLETSLTSTPVYIDSVVSWVRSADPDKPPPAVREWTDYLEQIRLGPEVRRDMTAEQRRRKPTLPGSDTAWPIGDRVDLKAAIQSFGRAKPEDREKVKAWIVRRARELGAVGLLPESWNVKK